jgi:tRNA (Thr-GGU) A37 N-methylase
MQLKPIGLIHSPFKQSEGTPIQAALAEGAEGTAVLEPQYLEGLKDLEGFERVWLLYWFDRAAIGSELIVTPYLEDAPHGVFATRTAVRLDTANPLLYCGAALLLTVAAAWKMSDLGWVDRARPLTKCRESGQRP